MANSLSPANQDHYQLLIETAREVIYRINMEGIIVFVNNTVKDVLGYNKEEIIGKHFMNFIPPSFQFEMNELFKRLLVEVETTNHYLEAPIASKSGKDIWMGQSILIHDLPNGDRVFLIVSRNIQSRIVAEEQMRLNEQKHRIINYFATSLLGSNSMEEILWDITYNCISTLSFEDCIVYLFNENRTHLVQTAAYGKGKEDNYKIINPIQIKLGHGIVGTVALTGIPEVIDDVTIDERYIVDDISRSSEITVPIVYENKVIGVIDSEHSQKGFFQPYHLETLQIIASLCSNKLMRAISLKERQINENKYKNIIENMPCGLIELNNNFEITKAYPRFCDLLGFCENELVGQTPNLFLLNKEDYKTSSKKASFSQSNNMDTGIQQLQLKKKDNAIIWAIVNVSPIHNNKGEVNGFIQMYLETTKEKELQIELEKAKSIAESARDAEKEFLANMSHEIRNPITSILGMTNLMFDTNVSSEQSEFLNNIKTSSEILLSLVNDILDLNKIDKEKITLNPIVFDPISLVRSHARNISLNLHNQKVKVRTYFDNDIPKRLLGDVTIINQILLNILGNASKFTHYGTISIQVKLLSRDHKLIWLKFQIDDTGIGISKDELEQIFERFNQAGKATNEKYGGTGLGLHITKKLTEFLGGRIYVESTLNIGSSFTVEIPFQVTDFNVNYIDQPRKTEDYKNKLSAQILIVEDNEINRKYLEKLLLKWNFPFQSAKNGLEALSKLETHQFDLVLMDIRMPIMDGYETSIKLRKMKGNCNQNIPIIALTASALADEKKRALAAGMNHHVTKPYRQEQLLGAIQKYLLLEKPNMIEKNHFQFTPSINQTELSELYDNDLIQVVEMFDLFIKNMPHELSLLHKLLEKGNSQEIKDQLHKIKPNFTYTGFNNISTQIKQLEQQVLSTSIDELGTEMSSTLKMMEESLRIVKVEYKRLSQFLQKK